MEPAPYHADVANGPPGERACWIDTSDGLRLRAVIWAADGAGQNGTVFLGQGRTEYIEKYSDAARELAARGFATTALDWRGQGLSPRSAANRRTGHVNDFDDFQRDVDAWIAMAEAEALPRPWFLLGHSMGGMIGYRALTRRREFAAAVFSAPMWGLQLPPHRRMMAWIASALAAVTGMGRTPAPSTGKVADPAAAPFDNNLLTTDPEMFAWMKAQIATYPDLALGGPSLGWVWAALREMHRAAREPAPDVRTLTFLGDDEDIVDPNAIHVRMASWPKGTLEVLPGVRHEVLMEGPEMRARVYDRMAAFLTDTAT